MKVMEGFANLRDAGAFILEENCTIRFKARQDILRDAIISIRCGSKILHAAVGLLSDSCIQFGEAGRGGTADELISVSVVISPLILAQIASQSDDAEPIAVFSSQSPFPLATVKQDALLGHFVDRGYLQHLNEKVGRNHWWLDACFVIGDTMYAQGWAIPPKGWTGGAPEISFDGTPAIVQPSNASQAAEIYWFLPSSNSLGFLASGTIRPIDGFSKVELSFGDFDRAEEIRRFAMYQKVDWDEVPALPIPPEENIHRVSGPQSNQFSYINGGKTDFERFKLLINETLGLTDLSNLSVLDWGVGCGRLARHFIAAGADVTGIDIDEGNLSWCRDNLLPGNYVTVDLMPPVQAESSHFDVIISSSVLSHLTEEAMGAWLKEMERLVKPEGVALISFNGSGNAYLYGAAFPQVISALDGNGFFDEWRTTDLDGAVEGAEDYYRFTIMSDERAKQLLSSSFKLERIVQGVTSMHQDIAVMRKL